MRPAFILRRLLYLALTFFVIITAAFFLVRFAPGSPFSSEKALSDEAIARQMARYGYDRPLVVQYGLYLGNIVRGNFGPSTSYPGRTVGEIIASGAPCSFALGVLALLWAYLVGTGAALTCAARPGTVTDRGLLFMALVGICVPGFLLAKLALYLFGYKLHLVPTAAAEIGIGGLILPALVLAMPTIAYVTRLGRKSLTDEMHRDYVRTARAIGLGPWRILLRHVFRNGCLPLVTFMGPAAAALLTGSVVIEQIFALPGLGKYFVYGALNRDHFLVLGMVMLYSVLLLSFNFIVDILYHYIDPRIRAEDGGGA
ncbi:MAG: ABC transporter permease [Planctomycetota bacterium]